MSAQARKRFTSVLLSLIAAMMLSVVPASAQQFATVNVPGSTSTSAGGINDLGQIVGGYTDDSNVGHGFLLSGGAYTTIDYPQSIYTALAGINNLGQMVGNYTDGNNAEHGFSLINGVYTAINDPAFPQGTYPAQISDVGTIAGLGFDAQGVIHGFTLINGVYTTIDYPGASSTQILDMSFNGTEMVGVYQLPSFPTGTYQGFTLQNGVFTSITYPGSGVTQLTGVTNVGQVSGAYALPGSVDFNAFVLVGNNFTIDDFPGAISTIASNMNDLGQVTGVYVNDEASVVSYLMTNGPFAYVANNGTYTVSVIDVTTGLVVTNIPITAEFASPDGIAISPNGQQVYVSNFGGYVSVISTATNTVTATIPVVSNAPSLAFTPDGTAAYVPGADNAVSVINTATQTVTATVPVGRGPNAVAMAVTSEGTFAYVPNTVDNTVSVIAVGPNPTVVATINVGTQPNLVAAAPNSSLVYVVNTGSSNVSVISVATNTVTATIPVGSDPLGVAFSPDSSTAYVTNLLSNTVSVINTASGTVVNTITGLSFPDQVALSADGSKAYVTDENNSSVSVISTATNSITGTIGVGATPLGIAIAAAPPTSVQVTQPLNPTKPNVFNYGTHSFTVQYPPGSSFSGINMTTTAVEITQAQFSQRVAGTQFANATCIVYGGTGGNCIDYQVTCSNSSGPVACPSESTPSISVETSFTTQQPIINPGYLTTPIGENDWTNIFTGYSDPLIKGKTQGFSEFVGVDLGVTNPQGLANFQLVSPKLPATAVCHGGLPVIIRLTSVVNGAPITGATAGISAVMVADGNGKPVQGQAVTKLNAFAPTSTPGDYEYAVFVATLPPGTYNVTIFGDSFAAQQFQVKLVK